MADLTPSQVEFMDALCMHVNELGGAPEWINLMTFLNMRESQFWGTVSNLVTKCYITKDLGFIKIHLAEKGIAYYHALYPQGVSVHKESLARPEDMGFHAIPETIEEIDALVARLQSQRETLSAPKMRFCPRCEHEKPVGEFGEGGKFHEWCGDCQRENNALKNEGRKHMRAIIKICKKEGGGRLAGTFLKELAAGLAALDGARPFTRWVQKMIGDYNKKD